MITVEQIRKLATDIDNNVIVTEHVRKRMKQRQIKPSEISHTLRNGEIIEQYPNDFPYPSCLLLSVSSQSTILHLVVGIGNGKLWIVTAYRPDFDEWENDFKTRRK